MLIITLVSEPFPGCMGKLLLFFFFKIFWCGPFLKFLLNLLQNYLCFMFWVFWPPEACGILAPWTGIEPSPLALEGKVLTARTPGKSWELNMLFFLKTWVVSVTGEACDCSSSKAWWFGGKRGIFFFSFSWKLSYSPSMWKNISHTF